MGPGQDAEDSGIRLGSVGPYLIERELRRGGMGTVYLARTEGGEVLALKMALRDDPQSCARFAQEIRATRSLEHPGIVRVHDDGEWHGRVWYAMDFVSEVNLADVLGVHGSGSPDDIGGLVQAVRAGQLPSLVPAERRGLPQPTALAVMRRVVEAVAHAHSRGVLHRDLKPSNILLGPDGDPLLADFGVARDLASTLRLTADHEVVGTYTYIAPEQLAGDEIDERADVYALGAMLYECLTGRPPPRRRDGCERLRFSREIPADLRRIVYQSLEPEPERRTRSAAILAGDLRRFERGESVLASGPSAVRIALSLLQRNLLLSSLVAALALVCAGLLVLLMSLGDDGAESWSSLTTGVLDDAEVVRWRDANEGAHAVGRGELPPARGVRVSARMVLGGDRTSSVFLGAERQWADGYRVSVRGHARGVIELHRGEALLWLGPIDVDRDHHRELVLQRLDGVVSLSVDGRRLVAVEDLLPLVGGSAGVVQEEMELGKVPEISLTTVPVPSGMAREWSARRMAAGAARAGAPAARRLLELAEADVADLLRRAPGDDARRGEWLLLQGAIRAASMGGLTPSHDQALEALDESSMGRLAYHQQRLLAAASASDDDALRQRTEVAAYHLDTVGLAVLACWAQRGLAGPARGSTLERLLPRLVANEPLTAYLRWQLATQCLEEEGDLDTCLQQLLAAASVAGGRRSDRAAVLAADLAFALAVADGRGGSPAQVRRAARGGMAPAVARHISLLTDARAALTAERAAPAGDSSADLLRWAGAPPPATGGELVAQQGELARLAIGAELPPAELIASRAVLAARLAAAPGNRVLLRWAHVALRGSASAADADLALAIRLAAGGPDRALVEAARGDRRALLAELASVPPVVPATRLAPVDGGARLLELAAAVRCIELRADTAARARLADLMGADGAERWAAERLLRDLPP